MVTQEGYQWKKGLLKQLECLEINKVQQTYHKKKLRSYGNIKVKVKCKRVNCEWDDDDDDDKAKGKSDSLNMTCREMYIRPVLRSRQIKPLYLELKLRK